MNQLKIGRLIAECRKKKNLTQLQLAEKLNITDKAISKWERGIAMPDTSIMLELCEILGITVNELLSGERTMADNQEKKNEELLLAMAKEMERKNKTIWNAMWIIMTVSFIALLAGIFAAAFFMAEGVWQIVTILGICIVFLIPCFYALKLEISVGVYKCKKCGEEIIPTYSEALWAKHMGFTRHLHCPKCKKRTWCKKIVK